MASKFKDLFVCRECGYESPRWEGQCRSCNGWNTFEEVEIIRTSGRKTGAKKASKPQNLSNISVDSFKRIPTGISELDRTLGGGFVLGQVTLLCGTPGIGKSTILLQLANSFKGRVLYVSGEESESQIALRAERLGIKGKDIGVLSTNSVDAVICAFSHELLIVDSIQVMSSEDILSHAGSVTQVRECAAQIIASAKKRGYPAVIVGHITKDGAIAGPKVLEHMVDTVLYLEGDKSHMFRMLRVHKNRFGDDAEVGIFQMDASGLQGVKNPAQVLLDRHVPSNPGTAVAIIMEGSRPLSVEVQALTVKTSFGYPKRAASGFSLNRLQLLCAVIQKKLNMNLLDQDVYVNIASGLNIKEPAVDLAICAAIISSYNNKPIPKGTAFFGEIGLSGEVRSVMSSERRVKEAKSLGFTKIVSPDNAKTLEFVL